MYIEYYCSCCKDSFQSRKTCLAHEKACVAAEEAATLLEQLPKQLDINNIGDVIRKVKLMSFKLADIGGYLKTTKVRSETFFLGGTGDKDDSVTTTEERTSRESG